MRKDEVERVILRGRGWRFAAGLDSCPVVLPHPLETTCGTRSVLICTPRFIVVTLKHDLVDP